MKIKSYFVARVADAVEAARKELGPEAMLVETRKSPPESQDLGAYEVVFAVGPEPRAAIAGPGGPALAPAEMARLSTELGQMRRQLEAIRITMRSGLAAPRWLLPSSELADVFSTLVAAEVSGEVAQAVVDRLHAQSPALDDRSALDRALAAELESRFTTDASLGKADAKPRVAALVGPPGSGKTTTLVKLAVTQGLAARRTVELVSLDNYRVGAAEQLRAFAAILGVGFQALETPSALEEALAGQRGKSLVLIDTPGYGLGETDSGAELAQMLRRHEEIDVHLVLSASMKPADLTRVVEAFEMFRPAKLLFTKLDETESFGPILCEAARTRKPLSFLGTGQRIPEELAPASAGLVIDLILRGQAAAECCAA